MKEAKPRGLRHHLLFIIFLVCYTAILAYKIIGHPTPFFDWDESIYVQTGHEMVSAHSLVPLWQGVVWLEKPPLVPFLYGILINYAPLQPEISTRLLSLIMSCAALTLIYLWVYRTTKQTAIATLTAVITAFNPIFAQRAQTVNTDVFLLVGWLGYFLSFPSAGASLFFLFVGVFSKSLLGFYPAILCLMLELYYLITVKNYRETFCKRLTIILFQVGLLSLWYIGMYARFGNEFIRVHILDHMVARVTKSIESHFGKRTYYIDLVVEQFGLYTFLAVSGVAVLTYQFIKKRITPQTLFLAFCLVPWFLFLNLTKTKISWYIYPALPGVIFLMTTNLTALKRIKYLDLAALLLVGGYVIYRAFTAGAFLQQYYSTYDTNFQLSQFAREDCSRIDILLSPTDRHTYEVLKSLHLTISTSTWYGNHPAIVYYSGHNVDFVYDSNQIPGLIAHAKPHECLALDKADSNLEPAPDKMVYMKRFGDISVFRKR